MDISTLLFFICALFALVVCAGAAALKVVGFSFCQGVVITTTFLVFGTWHPMGWGVLIACVMIRRRQVAVELDARNHKTFIQSRANPLGHDRAAYNSIVSELH